MKQITVYNTETGLIRKSKTSSEDIDIEDVVREGEAYIEGAYSPSIYSKVVDGVAIVKEEENTTETDIRRHREALLSKSDWTQMPDSPLSDSKKTEWATYRQALRDITSHSNWPNVEEADWPTQPS